MAAKRIILLLDGTWNDQDFGSSDTNIVRLQQIIAKTLGAAPSAPEKASREPSAPRKLVEGFTTDAGLENIVFYERGVGTGAGDRFRGGILGEGLDGNVRRAYKFLSFWYEEEDQVFIFGFSRGAFTARSLAGYIAAAGLLRRELCTAPNEAIAWNFYRTDPNDRLPGVWAELTGLVHDREKLHLDCVGVFDTVGALGIPAPWFDVRNRDRFAFHNVELSSITKVNLQAIALDEHRSSFQAAIWRKPKFKKFHTITEQVWFPGAHADIGGSYIDETTRAKDHPQALDDITLDWMIKRVRAHFPGFPLDPSAWKDVGSPWAAADQHEPRQGAYRLEDFAFRSINNLPLDGLARGQCNVCWDRHADPIGEMVHISALERLGKTVNVEGRSAPYAPANLLQAIKDIKATYRRDRDAPPPRREIRVVNWSGRELEPLQAYDQTVVGQLLSEAGAPAPLKA